MGNRSNIAAISHSKINKNQIISSHYLFYFFFNYFSKSITKYQVSKSNSVYKKKKLLFYQYNN